MYATLKYENKSENLVIICKATKSKQTFHIPKYWTQNKDKKIFAINDE